MKPNAIVYTSNTGYTARYAALLGEQTGLPVCSLPEAAAQLEKGTPVIYLGWLMAGSVKDYAKAARTYTICAVCGVGLCDTGTMLDTVRKACRLPDQTPVFTLQGGMDFAKMQKPYRVAIRILTKAMAAKKNRSADEDRMLYLLQTGGDLVNAENLTPVMVWYQGV